MFKIRLQGATNIKTKLDRALDKLVKETATVAKEIFQKNTPKRTGNARKNWNTRLGKRDFELSNRVPYIERLDNGWSKQAPQGITKPSIKEIKRKIR